jgi:4'-phosphopantetheinyl transferase
LDIKIFSYSEDTTVERPLVLAQREVHVWYRSLQHETSESLPYELLSHEERSRAERFLVERPRIEYVLTRATLRVLLAAYLGRSPGEFKFSYSAQGKPLLENETTDLRFNVSHTDGLSALAFARGREIGVDVEKLRPECEPAKLAERFFSASERYAISRLSGLALDQAFCRCWTRKEAYIKAKGGGLSIPLDEFDVSIAEDQPAALLATRPDPLDAGRWALYALPVESSYAAALAVSVAAEEQKNARPDS